MKAREFTHSEDSIYEVPSSSTSPRVGDYEGGTKRLKGNDYEVFLSFRGEDTRKGFTDYLYTSLVEKGICVLKDDNELHVGEKIGPELLCSIRQSTISIPIISENYTFSKWCLRELAQMLKCKRSKQQIVWPIFYKVKSLQVRHLKGRFEDAVKAHKENGDEMVLKEWKKVLKEVKEWEEALKEVGSLKGWESDNIHNGHEGAFVKSIVTNVMGELKRLFRLNVPKQLVGIDDRINDIMSSIDDKLYDTKIIGYYGMGGIGKTTLGKVLYNKLSSHFEYHSFVENIRETYQRQGVECIVNKLIYDIIGSSGHMPSVDEGIGVMKSLFTRKKVLVLLDDMDGSTTQLNALVIDGSWIGVGSIVIITTRDKRILDKAKASYMYRLDELSIDQSLILFSRHTFRKDSPPSDYKVLSHDIVSTTGGLPLEKFKKVPNKEVQETLKISYEALDNEHKQIFLDIACFFIGSCKQNPTYMWDACELFPKSGIEVLSLMSPIKIDEGRKLLMHDQLRDLGREIVRQENPNEPQERSRLWFFKEALDVLDNKKGTRKIEALPLDRWGYGKRYAAEQFKESTNLRFLQVDGANFTGDFQNLLHKLRWLQWKERSLDFIVTNFHPKKLVVLNLSNSEISENWGGWATLKKAKKLRVLDLSYCLNLKRTPNFSTFERLEISTLAKCKNLEELHHSFGNLASLIELNLRWTSITKLPESIGNLQNLRVLNISETGIRELPDEIGMLAKLQRLEAFSCKNLERLPSNICKLISLEVLLLMNCTKLQELPELPSRLTVLTITCQGQSLPHLSQLTCLRTLWLIQCRRLECVPELPIGLLELQILFCGKLKALTNLSDLKRLGYLFIIGCPSLERSPDLSNFRRTQMRELGLKETQSLNGLEFKR